MRKILFRGKQVGNHEWVYGNLIVNDGWTSILDRTKEEGLYAVIPETVGQCTGLTDKNGTKIFEGDVLRNTITEEIGFVAYHGTMAGFVLNALPRSGNGSFDFGELFHSNMKREIIGNIHDNPELLKKMEEIQ